MPSDLCQGKTQPFLQREYHVTVSSELKHPGGRKDAGKIQEVKWTCKTFEAQKMMRLEGSSFSL